MRKPLCQMKERRKDEESGKNIKNILFETKLIHLIMRLYLTSFSPQQKRLHKPLAQKTKYIRKIRKEEKYTSVNAKKNHLCLTVMKIRAIAKL